MKMNDSFFKAIQKWVAQTAIGTSTLRNQGSKGVILAARTFLQDVNLQKFSAKTHSQFARVLEQYTNELQNSFPENSKNWGAARKALNIFLRDVVYNKYLCERLNLEQIESWLELPLDKYVAEFLCIYDKNLPRWHSIKYLSKEDSQLYQLAAARLANEKGVARIHLDLWLWRSETKSVLEM
jgi:hypothetical protein